LSVFDKNPIKVREGHDMKCLFFEDLAKCNHGKINPALKPVKKKKLSKRITTIS
jgi:hypothetical protein